MTMSIDEGKIKDLLGQLKKIKAGSKADAAPLKEPISSGPSGEEVMRGTAGQAAAARRAEQQSAAAAELKGSAAPPTSPPSAIKQGIDDVEAVLPRGRPVTTGTPKTRLYEPADLEKKFADIRAARQPGESAAEYTARAQQHLKDLEAQAAKLSKPEPTLGDLEAQAAKLSKPEPTLGDQLPIPRQGPTLPPTTIDAKALDRALFGHAAAAAGLYAADKLSKGKSNVPEVPSTIKIPATDTKTEPITPVTTTPRKTDYSLVPDTNESQKTDDLKYIKSAIKRLI